MTEKRVEHTVSIGNVFDTFDEAVEFRKKVKNPHLYGVYGMWQSENKQLWVIMPMVALEALSNFRDQDGWQTEGVQRIMKATLKDLIGKTMTRVENVNNEELVFTTTEGRVYMLHHAQDCCERVSIESIVGDLNDLVGEPLLMAEEATSNIHPDGYSPSKYEESFTWTFYKFATRKGYVDVRWFGESNGYYSERVDFSEVASNGS